MNYYLDFLKRRFLWAIAGLVAFLSYSWFWGGPFVAALLGVTGLSDVPHLGLLGPGQWVGLALGTLLVMSPALAAFAFYMVAWIGWPGRPLPEPRRQKIYSGIGLALAIAVAAFLLVGLIGNYWPPSAWRRGLGDFASMADLGIENAEWIGDMYFGLFLVSIGLYIVVTVAAVRLPPDLRAAEAQAQGEADEPESDASVPATAPAPWSSGYEATESPEDTERPAIPESPESRPAESSPASAAVSLTPEIRWPYTVGAAVVVLCWAAALWPHLT